MRGSAGRTEGRRGWRRPAALAAALVALGVPRASAAASHPQAPRQVAVATAADPGERPARVVFILTRQRDDLGDLALSVSDPASRSYGRHRAVETIAATYGASRATIRRVAKFVAGFGAVAQVDVTGTFSSALLTRAQSEAMFGPDPRHSPPVPAELAGDVTGILGAFRRTGELAAPRPRWPLSSPGRLAADTSDVWPAWSMGSGTPASCPSDEPIQCSNDFPNPGPPAAFVAVTPDQLRTAYGIDRTGLTGRGRSAAVVEFGETIVPSDIAAYSAGLGLPPLPLQVVALDDDGGIEPGPEATLDVETIAGLAPNIERLTMLTSPAGSDGEFRVYTLMLYSMALDRGVTGGQLIDALSSSWGVACEPRLDLPHLVAALETVFQTAAAAGVTVSIAAGDFGSSGCLSPRPPYDDHELAVFYPGSSPWVTSIGGTNLVLNPDNTIRAAQVWNDWPLQLDQPLPDCATPPCRPLPYVAGAGGESILFVRPPWQEGPGVDPAAMRQVPDVAFLADVYPGTLIYRHGSWTGAGNGTSQAAPIFAVLALLLNEDARASGRPRLGFANPLLYALGRSGAPVFVDVIAGDNVIGDQQQQFDLDCCFAGVGYDLASGWGSLLLDRTLARLGDRLTAIGPRDRLPLLRSPPS